MKLVVWEGHPAVPFWQLGVRRAPCQDAWDSVDPGTRVGLTSRCANPGLPAPPITHLEEKRLRVRYTRGV